MRRQPLFNRDLYGIEYPPSIDRIRSMQNAARAEAEDEEVPRDARRHNLRRMGRFLDVLLASLEKGGDHEPADIDPA